MIPNILSIAGSDPSGGAGIQADLKSISANGGYGMAAVTALTAQNTTGVFGVQLLEPEFIRKQICTVLDDITVHAIKIGMLGTSEITKAVVETLSGTNIPIVVDPVMVAKGGDRLLAADAVDALRDLLLPIATIITPNLPEAADLLGTNEAQSIAEMQEQAAALLALGPSAVLLKGGHLPGSKSPDILLTHEGSFWFEAARLITKNTHGTGCTLSSALATQIPINTQIKTAVQAAKEYTFRAISGADMLDVGRGHGPTDHFFSLRN